MRVSQRSETRLVLTQYWVVVRLIGLVAVGVAIGVGFTTVRTRLLCVVRDTSRSCTIRLQSLLGRDRVIRIPAETMLGVFIRSRRDDDGRIDYCAELKYRGGGVDLACSEKRATLMPLREQLHAFAAGQRLGQRFVVRPAWARSWRWKSSRKLATANEVKRNCTRATECGEEAWSETASRWTRTRYEAQPSRASGQRSAKLSWPRLRRRKSGGCAGKDRVLTWGDLASWLKGRRGNAERGVSRGRSSCLRGVKGRTRRKADNHVSWTCSASEAWATGANRKRAG